MARYYQGRNCTTNPKIVMICAICESKVPVAKVREDKKNICINCYLKDEEREDLPE